MADTVSDFMVQRLQQWGVERIYGYSGDGINGMMDALHRAEDGPRLIQTRHEELAGFMASAHAKFTGTPGVCVVTSGPGAVHVLNGLYDAKKDHVPAVAILGQQARMSLGSDYQQEIDLISLYKDVAGDYVHMVSAPAAARHMLDQAMRIAMARRTVTAVILPNDVQDLPMAQPPASHGAVFSGIGYEFPRWLPKSDDLDRAAEVLNAGKKVAVLAGAGCKHAVDEVLELTDKLCGGLAKAINAKTMIPDDVAYVTGTMGMLGTRPSQDMMNHCDTLFLVGTRFPYAEFLPAGDQARGVQIDIDAEALGLRFPTEVNLQGDTKTTVAELLKRIERKTDRKWQDKLIENTEDWWQLMSKRAAVSAEPINPQQIFWSLNQRLPDNVILSCDVGSSTNWYARFLKIRRGMSGAVSGGHASMGNGVPYAVAAKFACPDRPVIAMVGDGAMQMLGNQGLLDIAKYWREWANPRCIVLVLNNQDLNQVSWEQRIMEGNPKFDTSQDLPDFAFDEYAKLLGLEGLRMSTADDVDPVWNEALAADRPVVINAYTDPEVAPLPPHISSEQAKAFLASTIKGDSDASHMVMQSMKQATAKYRY